MKQKKNLRNKLSLVLDNFLNLFLVLFGLMAVFILLQVFCMASFKIPSDSMEPSLLAGDNIIVNKLAMGARLFNVSAALNGEDVSISRLPGLSKAKHNDVLVFNFPYPRHPWDSIGFDVMKYYVKRCVALPGDTLEIQNGYFKLKGKELSLGNENSQRNISALPDSCTYVAMKSYPWNDRMNWTIKNFGPLPVPRKGQTVTMNAETAALYHQLISWEQKRKVATTDGRVYLGDSLIHAYRFTENYYFMAGDKLEDSQDSRYWGLLPESYIVGKAAFIWKSTEPMTGKIRWNRILKSIDRKF